MQSESCAFFGTTRKPSHLPKYLPMPALRLSKGLLGGN